MKGLLLINLGTPDAPTPEAVGRYLKQFLMDPSVIDVNPILRWILVHLLIVPKRVEVSAEAYKKIWTDKGSPLLVHAYQFVEAVSGKLGSDFVVEIGMRYGEPSIEEALRKIVSRGATEIKVFPLYPQLAQATTQSSIDEVVRVASKIWKTPPLSFMPPFYNHPSLMKAFASKGKVVIGKISPDHILFSFHGLPERQVRKVDHTDGHCLVKKNCCESISEINQHCYRAQCFATAKTLAQELKLEEKNYTVCFQSRLGKTPWIKPYTEEVIVKMALRGRKRMVVFCPSFVMDCLETLEEIQIRAKKLFLDKGGYTLAMVPSLNSDPLWVEGVCKIVGRMS